MTAATCPREESSLGRVQDLLADFFDEATARASSYGPHFERLWREAGRSVSGGKLVRPLLLLNAYDALTSEGARSRRPAARGEAVERLAVAVELLHYAFLLHDDVIDGDLLRRGRPNLVGEILGDCHRAVVDASRALHWAQTCGILMGDLLLSASHQGFARADVPQAERLRLLDLLDLTITDSVAGEQVDVGLSDGVVDPELATILDMTTRKTATYTFELPLRMAAVLAGAPGGVERRLGRIGRHLGLAFQLQDDLLCAFGDPELHGKDRYSDLREGKQTAIIAAARATPEWPRVEALLGEAARSEENAATLSGLLAECGAQARVVELAERELRSAGELIHAPVGELPVGVRRVLLDLIGQLRGRSS